MLVAFRVDASLIMGTGHMMRCLTLADELVRRGCECLFLHRQQAGELSGLIRERGHRVHMLSQVHAGAGGNHWLGCPWRQDAEETMSAMGGITPEWLVVDHYGLDAQWESTMAAHCRSLMVIDDLADRPHRCELLLDQNLGRAITDYSSLVTDRFRCLLGPRYALLRPEFAQWRRASLERRMERGWPSSNILVSMGGVDADNVTGDILSALVRCHLPRGGLVTVVMGQHAPHLASVRQLAAVMPFETRVEVQISDMARRMAEADLAIGAAGSTSWERACLGLPGILVVLAENQRPIAEALASEESALVIPTPSFVATQLSALINKARNPRWLSLASARAARLCDGQGCARVADAMLQEGTSYE